MAGMAGTPPEATWVKTREAADRLEVTPETLTAWIGQGRVPEHQYRKLAKGYRFREDFVRDPVLRTVATASVTEARNVR